MSAKNFWVQPVQREKLMLGASTPFGMSASRAFLFMLSFSVLVIAGLSSPLHAQVAAGRVQAGSIASVALAVGETVRLRGGKAEALRVGMPLEAGDRVRTGMDAVAILVFGVGPYGYTTVISENQQKEKSFQLAKVLAMILAKEFLWM